MVDEIIESALACDHIQARGIEDFTIEQLIELSEKARKADLLVTLRDEHSNFYQGVTVNVVKRSHAYQFIDFI